MAHWTITVREADPTPFLDDKRRAYSIQLDVTNDEGETIVAGAAITHRGLEALDDTPEHRAWPAIIRVAADLLAMRIRDGERPPDDGVFLVTVTSTQARAWAGTPVATLPSLEPGAVVHEFDD